MSGVRTIGRSTLRNLHRARRLVAREKQHLLSELGAVQGLMPLLMKPRNHQNWSHDDRLLLAQHLKRLSLLSPYLVLLVAPGGFIAWPALAWWLDRRRVRGRAMRLRVSRGATLPAPHEIH